MVPQETIGASLLQTDWNGRSFASWVGRVDLRRFIQTQPQAFQRLPPFIGAATSDVGGIAASVRGLAQAVREAGLTCAAAHGGGSRGAAWVGGGREGAGGRVALGREGVGGCEEGEDEGREDGKKVDDLASIRIRHYDTDRKKAVRAETLEKMRLAWEIYIATQDHGYRTLQIYLNIWTVASPTLRTREDIKRR